MYLVRITELGPQHVLARPVTNSRGAVLCPAGLQMTPETIERLKKAGIESVVVEGGDSSSAQIQKRIENLDRRFEGVTDPLMVSIQATIKNRLHGLMSGEGT